MQDIENYFIGSIPQLQILGIALLKATLILVLGYYFSRFIRKKISQAIAKRDAILGQFISQVIFILSIVVIIIAALGTIGVQTNSIIAVLGTAGVAITLGLKDSLSSVASGIILIILRPFKQGDLIEISG
uniref:mechanosensitive ion channel family protein n=1 Tax=uncultured Helicobacter sp. TaxID=175537 RepID=UPI0026269A81